jgi:hypothetical protein
MHAAAKRKTLASFGSPPVTSKCHKLVDIETGCAHVFTLVHGTFVPNATWISADSVFSQTLKKKLPFPAIVKPFRWSGWNTATARSRAAASLCQHLNKVAEENPGARQYVVAHSHGGNIALEATSLSGVARIEGLVTLSTPFIVWRPANPATVSAVNRALAFLTTAAIAAPPAVLYPFLAEAVGWWWAWAIASLPLSLLFIFWSRLITGMSVKTPTGSPGVHIPLLIVRHSGDEATAALGAAQFAGWILRHVNRRLSGAALFLFKWPKTGSTLVQQVLGWTVGTLYGALAASPIPYMEPGLPYYEYILEVASRVVMMPLFGLIDWYDLVSSLIWGRSESFEAYLLIVGYVGYLVMLACDTWLSLVFMVAVTSLLVSILLFPFGVFSPLASLVMNLSVEGSPGGAWTVHHITGGESNTEVGLVHSRSYNDERVIALIARWVVEGSAGADAAASTTD